jgi:all-trans-8'-apo-beta-carotenal 15,15'-oxygenase
MTTTAPLVRAPWLLGFTSIEAETPQEVDLEVEGTLPSEVKGTLYRIGPARFEVGGDRYRHWFDGDGMVHAIHLGGGRASYRSRFVATSAKQTEDSAGRRVFAGGFATPPPGGPLHRLQYARPKNVANINVVSHAGALLALWEGGRPHRLDPDTLETAGEDDLGGILGPHQGFSAHPKFDSASGELWNFGVTYGPRPRLTLYRGADSGSWSEVARLALPHQYMVHDMALTPSSVVFVLVPVALAAVPIALMAGRKGYAESLRWRPRWGTTILAIDREGGASRTYTADPFMAFHLAGAREDADSLEIDVCSYDDMSVIDDFAQVMRGHPSHAQPVLERILIDSRGGVTRRRIAELTFEFPRLIAEGRISGVTVGPDAEFLNSPAVVNSETGTVQVAPLPAWQFAGEVIPVAGKWGLTVVLDGRARTSELRVFDLADLCAKPIAIARLPHAVPFGLHGNFVAASTP